MKSLRVLWLEHRLRSLERTYGKSFIGKGYTADTVVCVEEKRARLRKALARAEH